MSLDDRTLEQRYRVYRLRPGERKAVCVAAVPDLEGVGPALGTLAADEDFGPDDRFGILDACPGGVEPNPDHPVPGIWLVNPYGKA